MEGKGARAPFTAVIMGVLILGLVVAHIEAKSCCRNTAARNCYNACRLPGTPRPVCANLCDCINISGDRCPNTHPRSSMLESTADLDTVIEEVTTSIEAIEEMSTSTEASGPWNVWCPSPEAKACFKICRLTEKLCVERCGCRYSPRGV